jgi:hypothetical protein
LKLPFGIVEPQMTSLAPLQPGGKRIRCQ